MGLMGALLGILFGGGRNVVRETAEVFRENAEAAGQRDASYQKAALQQFSAEFGQARAGLFDRFVDALNRIPRPAMALGVLFLFVAAMVDPIWFGERMKGIALVPEPLWWLLGAIVSFYFGARHQAKGQDFQRSIAETIARTASIAEGARTPEPPTPVPPGIAEPTEAAEEDDQPNAALSDWRAGR